MLREINVNLRMMYMLIYQDDLHQMGEGVENGFNYLLFTASCKLVLVVSFLTCHLLV